MTLTAEMAAGAVAGGSTLPPGSGSRDMASISWICCLELFNCRGHQCSVASLLNDYRSR